MKSPIEFNSSIEFVVIGPLLEKDGIIIKSTEVGIDLIGMAYKIYRNSEVAKEDTFATLLVKSNATFVFGNHFYSHSTGRKISLLFCWRVPASYTKTDIYINIYNYEQYYKSVKFEFNRFIEDSFELIDNFIGSYKQDTVYLDMTKYGIQWNLSPVLLTCYYPNFILNAKHI